MSDPDGTSRLLALSGAVLIALALVVGAIAGLAMTGKVPADGGTLLSAHLAGLMGAFMIFGLGWSLPLVSLSPAGKRRLAWLVVLPNFANWLLTTLKAFLRVHGLEPGGSASNSAIFALLTLFVVLPILGATVVWAWSLRRIL